MVRYLYDSSKKMMGDYWTYENRGWVLQKWVEAEIFGNNKVLTYSSYLMLFLFLQSFQLSTNHIYTMEQNVFPALYSEVKDLIQIAILLVISMVANTSRYEVHV